MHRLALFGLVASGLALASSAVISRAMAAEVAAAPSAPKYAGDAAKLRSFDCARASNDRAGMSKKVLGWLHPVDSTPQQMGERVGCL